MLSFQINNEVSSLLKSFDKASTFISTVESIDNLSKQVEKILVDFSEGDSQKINDNANKLRSCFSSINLITKSNNSRIFFSSLEEFQKDLNQTPQSINDDLGVINIINKQIDLFAEEYDSYIKSHSLSSATSLFIKSNHLMKLLNGFKTTLLFFKSNLEQSHYDLKESKELSLVLPSPMSLSQFSSKLQAINAIYEELCMLLNISLADSPIQIGKVESGSLWAKLFGDARIISMMISFIEEAASFIYRTYTNEGKISSIPRKIEAVEKIIELSKKLEEVGVDTEQLKEHINKSAVILAKNLNILIDEQPKIIMNGKTYSIGEEIQKKISDFNIPLRIGHDLENND